MIYTFVLELLVARRVLKMIYTFILELLVAQRVLKMIYTFVLERLVARRGPNLTRETQWWNCSMVNSRQRAITKVTYSLILHTRVGDSR